MVDQHECQPKTAIKCNLIKLIKQKIKHKIKFGYFIESPKSNTIILRSSTFLFKSIFELIVLYECQNKTFNKKS